MPTIEEVIDKLAEEYLDKTNVISIYAEKIGDDLTIVLVVKKTIEKFYFPDSYNGYKILVSQSSGYYGVNEQQRRF